MGFSDPRCLSFPRAACSHIHYKLFTSELDLKKCNPLFCSKTLKTKGCRLLTVKSVINGNNSGVNNNGEAEPARILLERLFAHSQKLEDQMTSNSRHKEFDCDSGFSLEILESDLLAALEALKKKEEDLEDAEKKVYSEHSELERAKKEIQQREREISDAFTKHERLEQELKIANVSLASQAKEIEDLRLRVEEREQEVAAAQTVLVSKEVEIEKMQEELEWKSAEAAKVESELKCKSQLLDEANEVVTKQDIELHGLRRSIEEKEEELKASETHKKMEEEKLKIAKANLANRTREWLSAQEELKKLANEASKQPAEASDVLEDFRRVKKLLVDVRSELVLSQKSLANSRKQMEEQELLVKDQLAELKIQRESIASYMSSLKDAQLEVESERVKHGAAVAQNKELEQALAREKELISELREELKEEKSSLTLKIHEMSLLQQELENKSNEFVKMEDLLEAKESELAEARLEIQQLKSERASLQHLLEEKDRQLLCAKQKLQEVNKEIADLKKLMTSKEDQLIQAAYLLKEKEEYIQTMKDELDDSRLKYSEAETVIERIVELTNKLVVNIKDEDSRAIGLSDKDGLSPVRQPSDKGHDYYRVKNNQLEMELIKTRESLRQKESGILAAQRDLAMKDEELKTVSGRLENKERELKRLKDEIVDDANDLNKLDLLAQERIGDKTVGDFAIEKLQLEAAQLEVEAALSALYKIAKMSGELLNKSSLNISTDVDALTSKPNGSVSRTSVFENTKHFEVVKNEVARLSALTENLVKQAGIAVSTQIN